LKDDLGNILYERTAGSLSNNTNYKDTFVLSSGCYTFHFKDNGGDGLSFWANSAAGNGTAKFQKPNNTLIKNYNPDFGNEIYQQFTVGDPEYRAVTGINELSNIGTVNVFPNPASDMVSIDCNFTTPQNIQVEILNLLGGSVYVQSYNNASADVLDINTSSLSNGTYIVKIKSVGQEFTKKIFIQH
jgi:hypothetical protein